MEPILDDALKACIREVMAKDDNLDFVETVDAALQIWLTPENPLYVEDEEEFYAFMKKCTNFVMDEVMATLVLDGMIEMKAVDEEGEVYWGLTEAGIEFSKDRFGL